MEISQIIITICLVFISVTILFTGIFLVILLSELRLSLKKINKIFETTQQITESISAPVSSFSEFLMGFKNGFSIFNKFFKEKKDES
jgi:hypothetical protein